jgi:AGZA family xanthine/uracil permease-like MFS transporter
MKIYFIDGFCNALVAPLLGTSIVTVFIETAAGIVAGARTGLASVVTGTLFLISCLFATSIATIIPSEASGGVILVACFYIIQGKISTSLLRDIWCRVEDD